MLFARFDSTLKTLDLLSRSSLMVFLKWVLINLSTEKLLFQDVVLTGEASAILQFKHCVKHLTILLKEDYELRQTLWDFQATSFLPFQDLFKLRQLIC